MDDRIRKRRRAVKWERSRGRRTLLFLTILALGLVAGFLWLRSTDAFAVKRITATGVERVTETQIAAVTAGAIGKNLLRVPCGEVEKALEALPYVESAQVRRGFPNTLEIELKEYRPVARLQDDWGAVWLISDNGKVLGGTQAAFFPDLPLVVPDTAVAVKAGQQVPAGVAGVLPLAALVASEEVGARLPGLAKITVSAAGCAALVLEGGSELRLGDPQGLEAKLSIAVELLQQCLAQGRLIEYVDASVAGRVAVKAK
jgi:cell division protein FtsQ